jgi:hypothetical protein
VKTLRLVAAIWTAIILRDITPELARWLASRLETADETRREDETDE